MELKKGQVIDVTQQFATLDSITSVPIRSIEKIGKKICYDVKTRSGWFITKDGIVCKQCAGWSLSALLAKGIDAGFHYTTSKPAKHFRTAINHMINFLGVLSNEWAGAQAFSSVDTLLAPYIYKDEQDRYHYYINQGIDKEKAKQLARKDILREVEQSLQEFLFHINYPNRWGGQSPFSNITLDLKVPHDLKDQTVIIANEPIQKQDDSYLTYGDLQEYIDIFNKQFFTVYMKGDGRGKIFTFPIITINLTEYFFNKLDPEVRDLILEANVKFGATYFQNCINGVMNDRKLDEGDSRAMCCLHPDTTITVLFDYNPEEPEYIPIHLLIQEDVIENPPYKISTPTGFVRPRKAYRIKFKGNLVQIKSYDPISKVVVYLNLTPDHPQPVFYTENGEVKRDIIEAGNLDLKRIYHIEYQGRILEIRTIKHISYDGYVYDFELPTSDGLFYANGILTHNCRLQIDVKEMLAYSKGLFSAGDYVGSIGVVTLNMAVIGYLSKGDKKKFFKLLDKWMDIAAESLLRKKKAVINYLEAGLYPYTREYLPYKHFESHFLTIGYCGLHECLLNLGFNDGIVNDEGIEFAKEVLQYMNKKIEEYKSKYDMLFNLEATPAEGASFRLAKIAKKIFPDLKTSGDDTPYLTNSCHPPAEYQGDFAFLTKHQNELQPLHSGGTVVHYYVGSELSKDTLLNMLKILSQTNLPYFTITPVISICPVHGTLPRAYDYCPYSHTEEELEKYGIEVDGVKRIGCEKTNTSCN